MARKSMLFHTVEFPFVNIPPPNFLFHFSPLSKSRLSTPLSLQLMDKKEATPFFTKTVSVEEKVDGANLGISCTADFKLLFQNRSHFVTSASATQWKGLEDWVANHPGIWDVLTSPDIVLFGEWLYAQHSIHYTKLYASSSTKNIVSQISISAIHFTCIHCMIMNSPIRRCNKRGFDLTFSSLLFLAFYCFRPDYFLAFDIYNKKEQRFLSRTERDAKLKDTGIRSVPLIAEGVFQKDQLLKLLETDSRFHSGKVEGVYIRIDEGGQLQNRGKIVREDFIQEIDEHWSKKTVVKNIVVYE